MKDVTGTSEFSAPAVIVQPKNGPPRENLRNMLSALAEITTRRRSTTDPDLFLFIDLSV